MTAFPDVYEPRPSDFTARFSRKKARGIRSRPRGAYMARGGLVLMAAAAVPAFAAPDDWSSFGIGQAANSTAQAMPFEKPGNSFPGSAFYYLQQDDLAASAPQSPLDPEAHWDSETPGQLSQPTVGPAALSMRIDNSGVDRTRALQCLTAAIYYEAASESDSGQRAVAQVVLNRVAHPSYPNTVCGVVYQGSERTTGCQFSFTCDGSLARRPSPLFWNRAESVARAALAGYVHTPVGLATHYHTFAVHPYWAPSLAFIGQIGAHRFYRFAGRAGTPVAFRFVYAGGEPVAAPHRHSDKPTLGEDKALDPVLIQRAYDDGLAKAQQANTGFISTSPALADNLAPKPLAPAPVYSQEQQARGGDAQFRTEALPQSSQVRPEYANSGNWIIKPEF